jgi:hypothetical protein
VIDLNLRIRYALITLGWALITSTIALNVLYHGLQRPLAASDMLLFFVVSIFAGLLLVDAEAIMISFIALLAINIVMIYLSLTSPVMLGVIQYAPLRQMLTSALTEGAIGIVVRITILNLMVPALLGVILGGIVGERLRI